VNIESTVLPASWKIVRLGDICKTTSGGTPSRTRSDFYGGAIPWVKSGELCDGIVSIIEETITEEGLKNSSAKVFTKGSLLIALYGATVGKLGILSCDAATNQAVCGIFPSEVIETKYLFWYLRSIRSELIDKGQGGAQPNISQGIVKEIQVPLAPLNAQHKVVAEIEKQFSRLDEAIASLKRIQANLKRYKAAVLKAAVEGKLTEQWRKDHPAVEPADQLLKRILTERRPKWEESVGAKQGVSASPGFGAVGINNGDCNKGEAGESFASPLPQMKTKGIKPKDDSWKKRYKEPAGPDTNNLPELPEGWVWIRLGALQVDVFDGPFGSNLKSTDYVSNGVRVIRLENIGSREFIDGKESFVTEQKYEQLKKHTVGHGDIIFSSFVANETRVVMLPGHIKKAINKADCFCVRINDEAINKRYIETFLATRTAYEQLVGEVHGATRPRINTTQLKDCHVSMPPLAEQNEIVSELDRRLSVTEELETTIETNLKRAERLRQMILQQAFSGGLV